MKVFVVGGYIRDTLLGLDPKDMDFVVVGASEVEFINFGIDHNLGLKKIGADFPVFIDSQKREWALARKERKTGPGYKGFKCEFDPTVTLEEDLFRRDLTINALAAPVIKIHEDGSVDVDFTDIIDLFGGIDDLHNLLLVHVSNHFREDPVRVLRVARFAARYNFAIADHTQYMIQGMAESGELDSLVPERVWIELEKALHEDFAGRFFQALSQTTAMDHILPNFRMGWDDETLRSVNISNDPVEKWALATQKMTVARINQLNRKLKIPTKYANFAVNFRKVLVVLQTHHCQLTADIAETLFNMVDAYRNSIIHESMLAATCLLDNHLIQDTTYKLDVVFQKTAKVGWDSLTQEEHNTLTGPEIGETIRKIRKVLLKKELP